MIFHHSLTDGGDVESITKYHKEHNGWEDCGYAYIILKDGTIQNARDYRMVGAHAYGKNFDSIGVCLIGNFFKDEPTVFQIHSAGKLYHDACRVYDKVLKIEYHRIIYNPCPGPLLNREAFSKKIATFNPFGGKDGTA